MKSGKYLLGILVGLIMVISYFRYEDVLPPRTPLKIARNISELNISSEFKIVSFEEEWSDFNGDGSLYIEMEIPDSQFDDLLKNCDVIGYKTLPIEDPARGLEGALFLKNLEGLYKIRYHDTGRSAYDLVIIEVKTRRLKVYVSVS